MKLSIDYFLIFCKNVYPLLGSVYNWYHNKTLIQNQKQYQYRKCIRLYPNCKIRSCFDIAEDYFLIFLKTWSLGSVFIQLASSKYPNNKSDTKPALWMYKMIAKRQNMEQVSKLLIDYFLIFYIKASICCWVLYTIGTIIKPWYKIRHNTNITNV